MRPIIKHTWEDWFIPSSIFWYHYARINNLIYLSLSFCPTIDRIFWLIICRWNNNKWTFEPRYHKL